MDVDWRPAAPRKGVLRHLVCYKFEEGTAEEDKLARVDGFAELIEAVGTVRSFEWGTNNSPEGKTHGFTHCFCLTFDTEADRDAYLPHPAHVAYGEKHVKAADVLVLDTLLD